MDPDPLFRPNRGACLDESGGDTQGRKKEKLVITRRLLLPIQVRSAVTLQSPFNCNCVPRLQHSDSGPTVQEHLIDAFSKVLIKHQWGPHGPHVIGIIEFTLYFLSMSSNLYIRVRYELNR